MNASPANQSFDYNSPEHWDRVVDSSRGLEFAHTGALMSTMLDAIEPLSGARVLDIATGHGRLAIEACARGARVVGIDISSAALCRAEQRALSCSPEVAPIFLNIDARSMPLPSSAFDAATCLRSFWVLPGLSRCLREVHRVLKPGGQLVIQLWGPPRTCRMISLGAAILGMRIPALRLRDGQTGPFEYTSERLGEELQAAGFVPEATTWHTIDVRITSPEMYWREFGSLAGTAHAALLDQPAPVRAEIDAELAVRSRGYRDASGDTILPLTWAVCSARKPVSAAGEDD